MQSTVISATPVSVYPPSNRKRTREYSDEEHDKKRSHRMVEQRRRERMNGLIDELSALIPLSFLTAQPNRTRPNILTAAISYLEAAQKVLSAVEGASSLSLTRRHINDGSSNAHFNIDSLISAHHGHGADSGSAGAMAQHHQDAVHAASEQSVAKASFHVHHGPVSAAALAQQHHQHHHHHHSHHPDGGMGVSQIMPLTLNGSSTGCVNLSNIEASGVTIVAQAAAHHAIASQVQVGSERAARTRSTGTRRSTTPTTTGSPRTTSARTSPTAAILHTNTPSVSHLSNAPSSAAVINRNSSSSSASHMSAVSQHSTPTHHHSVASPHHHHHHNQHSAMSAIMEMLHSSSPHRSPVASSPSSSSSATTSPHHHHFYSQLPEPVSVVATEHHDDMAATSLRELESLATATTTPLNSTPTATTTTTTTTTSTVCGAAAAAAALASTFPEANESESNNLNAHAIVEPSHYLHHGVSIDELTMYS